MSSSGSAWAPTWRWRWREEALRRPDRAARHQLVGAGQVGVFINVIRLSKVFGSLPLALMKKVAGSMVKGIPVSPERQAELAADFRRTSTRTCASDFANT